jgi:hypothetical protein
MAEESTSSAPSDASRAIVEGPENKNESKNKNNNKNENRIKLA